MSSGVTTGGLRAHSDLVLAIAISAKERKDDVKLGQALNKLLDEDPSLIVVHNPETHEIVIWGQGDRYLGPKLAEPHHEDVPNLDRVERLPNASHWVHHDEAERVNELLVDFLAPASEGQNDRTSIA